ncbi:hypothetical protein NDU88_001189 [Pleurodeles waltl]|uniref:Uncharacterized protein n=1 Tax=Pleurodeles waltl TaxID=8319 RepID=A0AAV7WMU9_PLEWA|nr:hypothetical protein NDU88_001189 [Pleurodeles waltl]
MLRRFRRRRRMRTQPDAVRRWGDVDGPPPNQESAADPRERRNPARLPVERGVTRPCGPTLDKREPAGAGEGRLPRGGGLTARDPGTGGERHPGRQRRR